MFFMKSKIIKAMTFILMSISITGCKGGYAYNEESLFETDICGEWYCPMEDGAQYLKFDEKICTYEQNAGNYKYAQYTISELNSDIDLVEINSWQLYKFYNILGNYYEINEEIPDMETFELSFEHWGSKYSFSDDGILSVEYDKYIPVKNFDYYKKDNIIYDKDTDKILFYIVEKGIFSPQYYKAE